MERHLGLEGQPRVVFEHEKEGRVHRHVVWSRIDADTMKARSDSLTYRKHEAAAREIERDCGLAPVESVLVKDREGPRPERRAKDWEGFRGGESGLSPATVREHVTLLWQQSDSGNAFKAALESNGYILCKGDRRDYVIIDPAGDDHSLARRISGAKAAEVRERLSDIDRDALPTVAEGRATADAWGGADSDAAKAVRWAEEERRLEPFARAMEKEGRIAERPPAPAWTPTDKAAAGYAKAVKETARAGQDAYWQALIGGKPRTEADKLHDLMWGEGESGEKKKEPELER